MGNVSIIARRREDGMVQYGWGGNWGWYRNVGLTLQLWYNSEEMVDYLFGLGQVSNLCDPYSERDESISEFFRTCPTGEPHWISGTERDIFSKILFVDHGYFYEHRDKGWYYIAPGPFVLKIPFTLIRANLDESSFEFGFLDQVGSMLIKYIIYEYPKTDPEFANQIAEYDMEEMGEVPNTENPILEWCSGYPELCEYFDDWVVVVPDETEDNVAGFVLRRRAEGEKRLETIDWPGHPVHEPGPYTNPAIINYALSYVGGWIAGMMKAVGNADDVPDWFLDIYRPAIGDAKTEVKLIRENFDRLYHVSKAFDDIFSEGISRGRERYEEYVAKFKRE